MKTFYDVTNQKKKPRHVYKFKKPAQTEIFESGDTNSSLVYHRLW